MAAKKPIVYNAGQAERLQDADTLDVTIAQILADNTVTNAKLANMAASTFKGRNTQSTGVPEDVTVTQMQSLLSIAVKASTAEITTGTDDTKFATAKAIKDATINIAGVAAYATILASPRTIDGVSFDGSANITLRWKTIGGFTATPASTSTITFTVDRTATLKVGMPVKYTISSVVYYGIITAMANNLMTIAGAPLGGDVSDLCVGLPELVKSIKEDFDGQFAAATDTSAILNQKGRIRLWDFGTAHLVQYGGNQGIADTGTENRFNVKVAGNAVGTANTNVGLDFTATVANHVWSVVDINTSNYTINKLDSWEVLFTKVGNGDSQNAEITFIFVLE